jgi:hypothetical protein
MPVPPVTLMTTNEFVELLNRGYAENPPPDPNHYERALAMLDLVEPGAFEPALRVEADVEFIWGIYRNEEKDIVIVDHDVSADEPDPNSVLVHEFVHALQDQDVDLARFYEEHSLGYDSYLAVSSIVEGEARFHQSRFWASLLGLDPAAIDWTSHFQEVAEYGEEWVVTEPSPYLATYRFFPYELGARLVHHAWTEAGAAGVDALFASPPTRSQAIMASAEGVARADWPAPEFPALEAPAPFILDGRTSLGAWGVYIHLAGTMDPAAARSIALDLLGDELAIYPNDDIPTETVAVWRLEFSSEDAAVSFQAYEQRRSTPVVRDGTRVVLTDSTGSSALDWALAP